MRWIEQGGEKRSYDGKALCNMSCHLTGRVELRCWGTGVEMEGWADGGARPKDLARLARPLSAKPKSFTGPERARSLQDSASPGPG